MDSIMNEAMKRRKANGLEITITVEEPNAKGKEAQALADKSSDLAPNPTDEVEGAEHEQIEGEMGEEPAFGADEPMRKHSLTGRAHEAMKAKLKGKQV